MSRGRVTMGTPPGITMGRSCTWVRRMVVRRPSDEARLRRRIRSAGTKLVTREDAEAAALQLEDKGWRVEALTPLYRDLPGQLIPLEFWVVWAHHPAMRPGEPIPFRSFGMKTKSKET